MGSVEKLTRNCLVKGARNLTAVYFVLMVLRVWLWDGGEACFPLDSFFSHFKSFRYN
jgi:hypothetical protein